MGTGASLKFEVSELQGFGQFRAGMFRELRERCSANLDEDMRHWGPGCMDMEH